MDPAQLEQIIINLAVNAHDAMPQGGQLILATANVTLNETRAQALIDLPPGDYVTLTVRDTGIGISDDIKAHLFEPFFTTKERGYGTGLGLSTCYGIVKQNNGHITVDSIPNQGATFTIYLPSALEATPPQAAPVKLGDNHIPRGTETILLAEDDPAVRELAGDTLRLQGYTILEATHGLEALQIVENHHGPLHLLLTDVIMPYMGGRELAGHLSARQPRLKIIYISGYAESIITHDGVLESGINFIQKPFLPGDLARKVRQVLDQ
jgi:two-component system cell cycle sensor histidine kinase/response regulator CckA